MRRHSLIYTLCSLPSPSQWQQEVKFGPVRVKLPPEGSDVNPEKQNEEAERAVAWVRTVTVGGGQRRAARPVRMHTPTAPAGQTLSAAAAALQTARLELRALGWLESYCRLRASLLRRRRLHSSSAATSPAASLRAARVCWLFIYFLSTPPGSSFILGDGAGDGEEKRTRAPTPAPTPGAAQWSPHARTRSGLRPITWGGPGAREERQGRGCQRRQPRLGFPVVERRLPLRPPQLPHADCRRAPPGPRQP